MKSGGTLYIFCAIFFILSFYINNIFAQDTVAESSLVTKALVNARTFYQQSFGDQSTLYTGSQYAEYLSGFEKGQPYFYSEQPVIGSIIYDGAAYDSVVMRYNQVKDVLVISNHFNIIQLGSEKVESFNLSNSAFIYLVKDSLNSNLVSSGFYNLLYDGKISLFKKQIKTIREKLTSNAELLRFVDVYDHYYIKKEDKFYPIKSKKNLFEILGDNKKEVKQFINANGLNFSKDPQNTLTKTIAYYDSLKK
jgi:hypothetical protein